MLERIIDILIALAIFGIIFGLCLTILIESSIEIIKQRANKLQIECSDIPTTNSMKIAFKGETIYCIIQEPNN